MATRTGKLRQSRSIFRLAFLFLVAVATSVNALEMGGLIEFGTSELSLLWDSLDDHLWLSAMPPASADRRRQFGTRSARPPIRVVHYMGTNFGMTGVETFILQLAAAQKRAGLVPSIVMDLENRAEVQTIGEDLGIAVRNLPVRGEIESRLPRKLGTAILRTRRVQALTQILRDTDVLHIQAVGISCLDGFVAAALSRTKALIVTHHSTMSWFASRRDLLSDVTFWIEKRMASRVAMPYASAAKELIEEGIPAQRTIVVPFCVDETLFSGVAPLPASGELTLVMAARMYPGKGQPELLTALSKLHPRYPGVRALLVGDGPTRGEVEAEIDRRGLRNVVTSLGRLTHRDMPALMREAHVVVLPSYMSGEMFPICLIEGMALGLPAIATRYSGIPEIVEHGETGILVEPRDADALANAIERFLTHPAFYSAMRQKALARFRSHFASGAVANAYLEYYQQALNAGTEA